ncbi:hypothetical protein BGW36DRAFT_429737 [Talaromyces proteolyticus]|uniref:STE24 endopeptidase n=1 Tax=Talaromyces proteolyticus TaxID=1131652 RepID=A0AAD4KQ75_9EURO|nr:uncharacterized protein BGW36DRAFT_429737 [Talaromyces proteolyticus]KAH8693704.1 hypothetical protein BGW36DRAFT_429737 [Talaromyces proteolyticus]
MPTQLDKALNSKNLLLGFAGIVTAVSAWSIWGGDLFPAETDPKGDPEHWTTEELKRWLRARNLLPADTIARDELIERVKANLRPTRSS